jgi:hypothetical protein
MVDTLERFAQFMETRYQRWLRSIAKEAAC